MLGRDLLRVALKFLIFVALGTWAFVALAATFLKVAQ